MQKDYLSEKSSQKLTSDQCATKSKIIPNFNVEEHLNAKAIKLLKPSAIGDIDVVIPTHNRLWALKRSIPFYLAQREVKSIIIVNGASNDGTDAWLTKYCKNEPRLKKITHEKREGASAARNTGADSSEASMVFFADDDMIMRPNNALSIIRKEMIDNSGDVISPVLCLTEQESSDKITFAVHAKNEQSLFSPSLEFKPWRRLANELNGRTFNCCTLSGLMLMKKEVLNAVRYNEELGRSSFRDETDFQFKAIRKGFRLLACPQVCLISLRSPTDTGGCSHSMNLFAYELEVCRNNWRFLVRHKDDLNNFLRFPYPIEISQALFMINHFCRRLPMNIGYSMRKRRIEKCLAAKASAMN